MEGIWRERLARYRRFIAITSGVGVAAALVLAAANAGQAQENSKSDEANEGRKNGQAIDTRADYTPFERFTPLPASSPCVGAGSGPEAEPFVLPPGNEVRTPPNNNLASEYDQVVVDEEPEGRTNDLWDMNTQNEFGKDAGRFVYRAHEVGQQASSGPTPTPQVADDAQVSVTDLTTDETKVLAERPDWERFDGIVWTPYGTILVAEEVITSVVKDPNVPQATSGLVYELYVDRNDPSRLDPSREPQGTATTEDDGTTDVTRDGIRARPALGSKSHEGMRFDKRGFHYGIAETRGDREGQTGGIFRFIPDRNNPQGPLASGQLSAFKVDSRPAPNVPFLDYGPGRFVDLDRTAVQVNADVEAERNNASEYERSEDVETGQSTGRDVNNGGNTLYVAITEGSEEGVLAIDLSSRERPFAYPYVGNNTPNDREDFRSPDNLALDRKGNLAITEDPPGNPVGADIFIAAPPRSSGDDDEGGASRQPARNNERFASLKDCVAEPTGIYFALEGTEEFSEDNPELTEQQKELVTGESLFVNRQHSGQGTTNDQFVSIAPVDDDDDDDQDDDGDDDGGGNGKGKDKGKDKKRD